MMVMMGDDGDDGDDATPTTAAPVEDVTEGNVCIGDACDEPTGEDEEGPNP